MHTEVKVPGWVMSMSVARAASKASLGSADCS